MGGEQPESVRLLLLVLAVAVIVLAGVFTLFPPGEATIEPAERPPQMVVEPQPGAPMVWPYTSTTQSPGGRTLSINVIFYGDAETIRYYLTEGPDARWNETEEEWEDIDPESGTLDALELNETRIEWDRARGSTRYMYVYEPIDEDDGDAIERGEDVETEEPARSPRIHRAELYREHQPVGTGRWIDESYQLHDGEYFGIRDHLRVYEPPEGEWVAMQAHSEHWDWFRLRHTVDGIESAQSRVEEEFMGRWFVDDVWRIYLGNDDSADADGWASLIDLRSAPSPPETGGAAIALIATVAGRDVVRRTPSLVDGSRHARQARRESATPRSSVDILPSRWQDRLLERVDYSVLIVAVRWLSYLLVFGSLLSLYLFVRVSGIAAERWLPGIAPRSIALTLYPFIALGLPICAYYFARHLRPVQSFATASAGIGLAILIDYSMIGVAVLPIEVIVHRLGVAISLGLIAAGAVGRRSIEPIVNWRFAAGLILWTFLLIAPLVGWL